MSNKKISSQKEVTIFLKELKQILSDSKFNIETDLDILLKKNQKILRIHILQVIHYWHLILTEQIYLIN